MTSNKKGKMDETVKVQNVKEEMEEDVNQRRKTTDACFD